jgi:DNA-binding NarL/FixJ family response regulator
VTSSVETVGRDMRSVLIVEDDALLRELLAVALEQHGFVVETAATASDARRIFSRGDHDAIVMDVSLGPGPSGFDVAEAILEQAPHTAAVFLTNLPDPRFAERDSQGLPRGVAYLRKSSLTDVQTLVSALDAALRGACVDDYRHDRDPDRPLGNLTKKQIKVLQLAAAGKSNAQIAEDRGVSVKAVEDTIARAGRALAVHGKEEGNIRVAIVRRFLQETGGSPIGHGVSSLQ